MVLFKSINFISAMMVMALIVFFALPVLAQNDVVRGVEVTQRNEVSSIDPNLYVGIEEAYQRNMKLRKPKVHPRELSTMFFTLWQHKLLQEAKRKFTTRRPEDFEINKASKSTQNMVRGIRELSLGGIAFSSAESWIVWLNGERVTPKAIPKQVLDINVSQDYIELKWIDSFTNLVYPIRLRPHQRFNLDTRIFLPGSPTL